MSPHDPISPNDHEPEAVSFDALLGAAFAVDEPDEDAADAAAERIDQILAARAPATPRRARRRRRSSSPGRLWAAAAAIAAAIALVVFVAWPGGDDRAPSTQAPAASASDVATVAGVQADDEVVPRHVRAAELAGEEVWIALRRLGEESGARLAALLGGSKRAGIDGTRGAITY